MRYELADITSKLYKRFKEGEERPLIECYGYVLEMPEKEILFDFGKGGARKKEPFRGVVFIKDFRQLDIAYQAQQKNKGKNFSEVEFFKRSGEILSHLFIREYNKKRNILNKTEISVKTSYKPDIKLYSTENSLMKDLVADIEKYDKRVKEETKKINDLMNQWKDML